MKTQYIAVYNEWNGTKDLEWYYLTDENKLHFISINYEESQEEMRDSLLQWYEDNGKIMYLYTSGDISSN